MAEDDDAAWEQLAAEIQASEQVAAASMGQPSGRRQGSRPPSRPAAPTPQGPSGVPQVQDTAAAGAAAGDNPQQQADMQLEAAMQEAIEGGWLARVGLAGRELLGGNSRPKSIGLHGCTAASTLLADPVPPLLGSSPMATAATINPPCDTPPWCRGRAGGSRWRQRQLDAGGFPC